MCFAMSQPAVPKTEPKPLPGGQTRDSTQGLGGTWRGSGLHRAGGAAKEEAPDPPMCGGSTGTPGHESRGTDPQKLSGKSRLLLLGWLCIAAKYDHVSALRLPVTVQLGVEAHRAVLGSWSGVLQLRPLQTCKAGLKPGPKPLWSTSKYEASRTVRPSPSLEQS